jgi:hypothetical protein
VFDIPFCQFFDTSVFRSETKYFPTAFAMSFIRRPALAWALRQYEGAPEGIPEPSGGAADYRHVNSGIPSERTFFGIPSVGDTAMTDDVAIKSRKALARVNAISERTIFWGMIFTALVAIAVMTRGVVG